MVEHMFFVWPLLEPTCRRHPQLLFAGSPSLHFFLEKQSQLADAHFAAKIYHSHRFAAVPEPRAGAAAAMPACSPSPPM